jgi:hypothetical protein
MAALLGELSRVDPATADEITLDLQAYRAERLRMHELVLSTLGAERTEPLLERERSGERLRVFSVGIGGLDLGMGPALARARGRSIGMGGDEGGAPGGPSSVPGGARPAVARGESRGVPVARVPAHGDTISEGEARIERREDALRGFLVRTGESGVDVSSRQIVVDRAGRAQRITRVESERRLAYRLVAEGAGLRAEVEPDPAEVPLSPEEVAPGRGLEVLEIAAESSSGTAPRVLVHTTRGDGSGATRADVSVSRADLVRLLLGREVTSGEQAPWPLADAADESSDLEARMILAHPSHRARPWGSSPPVALPPEVAPARVARAIRAWDSAGPPVVVGTDPRKSLARWTSAARLTGGSAILVLPKDGFPGRAAPLRDRLAAAFAPRTVVDELPAEAGAGLVVVVSHEAPDRFASRVRALARRPAMRGKLLAAWSLGGPLRDDLPAWVLEESGIAALGLGESTTLPFRGAERALAAFGQALGAEGGARVERLAGPFLWFY